MVVPGKRHCAPVAPGNAPSTKHPVCDGAFGHVVAVHSRAAMPPETPHPHRPLAILRPRATHNKDHVHVQSLP